MVARTFAVKSIRRPDAVLEVTGPSYAGGAHVSESYTYDHRNRLKTWTKLEPGKYLPSQFNYDYDELGNLVDHAGRAQAFNDLDRPHAIQSRDGGAVTYAYDEDGNVKSIAGATTTQHLKFNSANQLTCIGLTAGACNVNVFRYDIHGQRLIDLQAQSAFEVYADESFVYTKPAVGSRSATIEIFAFGERVANKTIPG